MLRPVQPAGQAQPLAGRLPWGGPSCGRRYFMLPPPSLSPQSAARTARPWPSRTPAPRRSSSTSPPACWRAPGSPVLTSGHLFPVPKRDQPAETLRGPRRKEVWSPLPGAGAAGGSSAKDTFALLFRERGMEEERQREAPATSRRERPAFLLPECFFKTSLGLNVTNVGF